MSIRTRLVVLLGSFVILLAIGRVYSGGFEFLFDHFWFTAGFFLLLLLSLIDQPHFSKDANVFVNGTTAGMSLLLVPQDLRSGIWWAFLIWAICLVLTSYALMWLRTHSVTAKTRTVQAISRLNRHFGRPEAIFSALFLWGCFLQFGLDSHASSALFLFWAAFMIINLPAIAAGLDSVFRERENNAQVLAVVDHLISPRIAVARIAFDAPSNLVGRKAIIKSRAGGTVATAVVIDDRLLAGNRIGRLGITSFGNDWQSLGNKSGGSLTAEILVTDTDQATRPIGSVESGSTIGSMVFHAHPDVHLRAGHVVSTRIDDSNALVYFQVISASLRQQSLDDSNAMHTVQVVAGQLGDWDRLNSRFEPVPWVAEAGQLVYQLDFQNHEATNAPRGCALVGVVPNSNFQAHVQVGDIVTHNTAIIGVTGSGKSFLAFHLIEAMIEQDIKVLILDISRQHDIYLTHHNPTALRTANDVRGWFNSDSRVGIHQFALDSEGYPKITADFVKAAFEEAAQAKLERGKNIPARLCVVFEEAHSLIPEWNQVAQQGDTQHVNRTARYILQGRKFGMGALVITQRTANVTKSILNQCNTMFALQSFDQTGLEFLKSYVGEEYSQAISTLPTRHAVLVGKASSSARPLVIKVNDMTDKWGAE